MRHWALAILLLAVVSLAPSAFAAGPADGAAVHAPVAAPLPYPQPALGAATPGDVQAWAAGIGLAPCVGDSFVAGYGRLPTSLSDLVDWGNSSGRRQADGIWECR